jgi:hypothetical protein
MDHYKNGSMQWEPLAFNEPNRSFMEFCVNITMYDFAPWTNKSPSQAGFAEPVS